jgi:hypothetical protein
MRFLFATIIASALACGPIPAGELSGNATPVPANWSEALDGERAICEIESRPGDPHSIQLDCFVFESALYVQSHRWALAAWWPVESWASIWLEHPDVRVRIGDAIFALRAAHIEDGALRTQILEARGYDPPPEGIVLFRFEPR